MHRAEMVKYGSKTQADFCEGRTPVSLMPFAVGDATLVIYHPDFLRYDHIQGPSITESAREPDGVESTGIHVTFNTALRPWMRELVGGPWNWLHGSVVNADWVLASGNYLATFSRHQAQILQQIGPSAPFNCVNLRGDPHSAIVHFLDYKHKGALRGQYMHYFSTTQPYLHPLAGVVWSLIREKKLGPVNLEDVDSMDKAGNNTPQNVNMDFADKIRETETSWTLEDTPTLFRWLGDAGNDKKGAFATRLLNWIIRLMTRDTVNNLVLPHYLKFVDKALEEAPPLVTPMIVYLYPDTEGLNDLSGPRSAGEHTNNNVLLCHLAPPKSALNGQTMRVLHLPPGFRCISLFMLRGETAIMLSRNFKYTVEIKRDEEYYDSGRASSSISIHQICPKDVPYTVVEEVSHVYVS
eukprot:jgi/Mesvir1/16627/Mv10161-RA.1